MTKDSQKTKRWQAKHPGYHARYNNEWAKKNKTKVNASHRRVYQNLKDEVYQGLGNKCAMCGFSDPRALQIDHVNGDGAEERKMATSSSAYYRHMLKRGLEHYQILCANCNWIKRAERKEDGHANHQRS